MERNMVRERLVFSGWVQGVGFRYSACRAAGTCGLTGWVRNETGGSVDCEVQGSPAAIEMFIRTMTLERDGDLDWMDRTEIPAVEDETGFRIRYG